LKSPQFCARHEISIQPPICTKTLSRMSRAWHFSGHARLLLSLPPLCSTSSIYLFNPVCTKTLSLINTFQAGTSVACQGYPESPFSVLGRPNECLIRFIQPHLYQDSELDVTRSALQWACQATLSLRSLCSVQMRFDPSIQPHFQAKTLMSHGRLALQWVC
jgi:hypothetical protein